MVTEIVVAAIAGASAVIGAWLNSRKTARNMTTVAAELKPNHGSSLRDAIDRIEAAILAMHETADEDRRRMDRRVDRVIDRQDRCAGTLDQLAAEISRLHPGDTIRLDPPR